MDDFILIHHDKEYLKYCLQQIESRLESIGMDTNRKKTYIQKVSDPIFFLGFVYRVIDNGKIIILADPKKVKHERKKIKRMVAMVQKGKLALCAFPELIQLNNVDLPTFGSPTMPHFNDIAKNF